MSGSVRRVSQACQPKGVSQLPDAKGLTLSSLTAPKALGALKGVIESFYESFDN